MERLLRFDPERLRRDYAACAFWFSHALHASDLFALPRLAELAEFLHAAHGSRDVYNAAAGLAPGERFAANGGLGISPGQAVEAIATSGSWVVLRRVEQDPGFRVIVNACLAEVAAAVPAFRPPHIEKAEGFIFITSPKGVTPYHIDPQWSFLAQIHGCKSYRIYDSHDPSVVSEPEIENLLAGDFNAAVFAPEKGAKSAVFALSPGDAITQPVFAPHTAEVGDDYSVSFSLAIVSEEWSRATAVRLANRWLRQAGFSPAPIGSNRALDAVKNVAWRAAARIAYRQERRAVS